MDFIVNGAGHGSVAAKLMATNFNPAVLRPYVGSDGRSYITHHSGGKSQAVLTQNAATLRKDEWIDLDKAVTRAAKDRLRVFGDLRASGLTYNVPGGMGKTVLESQRMGDITPARITMEPVVRAEDDRPEFDLVGLPLPVVHKDFHFSARQIAVSRQSGAPLDTTMAELAARRCAEEIEKLTLGTSDTFAFGGYTVYGYRNFPLRMTKVLTAPTAGAWTPAVFLQELLAMKQQSILAHHYGPWRVYVSPAWSPYLDDDYSAAYGGLTLRDRALKIEGISSIVTADYLPTYDVLMVQMTSDIVRAVIGMDMTTLSWETEGGLMLHYKVLGILVPQIRADYEDQTGIVHGAT